MEVRIPITFPTDEKGLTGRECPFCEKYFKVKFGTGLPTQECYCPYCSEKAGHDQFWTKAQLEYATSVAANKVLGPELRKLERSLKELERSTRGGFIQFKVESRGMDFPIKYYREKDLETQLICDNCGLEFAIYGVFANCPDCNRLNALVVFSKSIEVSKKKIELLNNLDPAEAELRKAILEDGLSSGVSAFDAFGKALRTKYPDILDKGPRNLFQNLRALSDCLRGSLGKSLPDLIRKGEFEFLQKMFQVRHIYEHNMGVVDDDFIRIVPEAAQLKGRIFELKKEDINSLLNKLKAAGKNIFDVLENRGL